MINAYILCAILGFSSAIYNPVPEPPESMRINWTVGGDVPSNAVIYYDLNGDRKWDIAYSHPIIPGTRKNSCDDTDLAGSKLYMVLSNCPNTGSPYSITVLKEPSAYMRPGLRWESLYKSACSKNWCPAVEKR